MPISNRTNHFSHKTSGFVWIASLFCSISGHAQPVQLAAGALQRFENFKSEFVQSRNIDVWLPGCYDANNKYPVLYLHDGQMLFDSNTTWNHQEWGVDETMEQLRAAGKIRESIVVGIWNVGELRHREYFPQKPFEGLGNAEKQVLRTAHNLINALQPSRSG